MFNKIPIAGYTDASGSATIRLGPLPGSMYFVGYVVVQVQGGSTGNFALQDRSGAPLGGSNSNPAVLGVLYLSPTDQAVLAITSGPANSNVFGYMIGDSNTNPALLVPPPAPTSTSSAPITWTIISSPAAGSQATISKAGIPGIRHVCSSFSYVFNSKVAIAASDFIVVIRDGASGSGTPIFQHGFSLPAIVVPPFAFGLSEAGGIIAGTPGNAMTIEFNAGVGNLVESVSLTGYDQ